MVRKDPDALPASLVVEHVGSTSMLGVTAKPIVELDVVVDAADLADSIAVEAAGWVHEGDLAMAGREAFQPRADLPPTTSPSSYGGALPTAITVTFAIT